MSGRDRGAGPEDATENGCRSKGSIAITRRHYLGVGAAMAVMAGCVGDDDDQPDPSGTADDTVGDDGPGDASSNGDDPLDVREDFDSYVLEVEVGHEGPDGAWSQRIYREADVANDRMFQQLEISGDEGEPGVFEQYIVDEEGFQIMPDGTCTSFDERTIRMYGENVGGFQRPDPDEVDEDAEHVTYGGTTSVDWVDESVHVWEFDLEPAFEAIDGSIEMYIGSESGYFVGYEGWYTTGAHDDPEEISIEYHQHSFNQSIDIEIPGECAEI